MASKKPNPLDSLPPANGEEYTGPETEVQTDPGKRGTITHVSTEKLTVAEVFESSGVDPHEWTVKTAKHTHRTGWSKVGPGAGAQIVTVTVWLTSITLAPVDPIIGGQCKALETLIEKFGKTAPRRKRPKMQRSSRHRRELELCIMDPHFAMRCHPPAANGEWSIELAEQTVWWAVETLVEMAESYGPFERIIFPFGNDWMHHDNLNHTTTAGTGQPEGEAYHFAYERGLDLLITLHDWLADRCRVESKQIPGNHDRVSSFTMGLAIKAWFRNDRRVNVDASASPYKFHRFGKNLIGYEHGHSVRAGTLPVLMANERPQDWAETTFREWHLGDQHRKASAKPSSFEEQGVSVEYLPGLTPPNEWHRLKGYNWQKRGAMAFVWDHDKGQVARLSVNLDQYTGKPMGAA